MKKMIVLLLILFVMCMIFWSCGGNNFDTEPDFIISLNANPGSALPEESLTVTCDATENDKGDNLTYSWSTTGGSLSTTTGTSTVWTAPSTVGGYRIFVTVSDGESSDVGSINVFVYEPTEMIMIQGGTFTMGDHFDEGGSDELPTHSVTVSDFYIGVTEVSQGEWYAYMPARDLGSMFDSYDKYPAYFTSWYEILEYCNLRSLDEGLTPCYQINSSTDPADWGSWYNSDSTWNVAVCNWNVNGYRLPTEAEWEYAARGGIHNSDNYRYSGSNTVGDVAWYSENSEYISHPHPVAGKLSNQLGLYDMSGNLYELCWDWYNSDYYEYCDSLGTVVDPHGPTSGSYRVRRGGSWGYNYWNCKVAYRINCSPDTRDNMTGFRVCRTP